MDVDAQNTHKLFLGPGCRSRKAVRNLAPHAGYFCSTWFDNHAGWKTLRGSCGRNWGRRRNSRNSCRKEQHLSSPQVSQSACCGFCAPNFLCGLNIRCANHRGEVVTFSAWICQLSISNTLAQRCLLATAARPSSPADSWGGGRSRFYLVFPLRRSGKCQSTGSRWGRAPVMAGYAAGTS